MNFKTPVLSLAVAFALVGAASAKVTIVTPAAPVAPPATMAAAATVTPPAPIAAAAVVTPPATTQAADPMNEADVRALLTSAGFSDINDVEFKEGTWTADAKSADGKHVEMRIDSATGKIYPDEPVATIGKDQIIIKLQTAGYTNVRDVEMEGGVWKAEANDSKGNDVEIKLDPNDGHVLGSKKDKLGAKH